MLLLYKRDIYNTEKDFIFQINFQPSTRDNLMTRLKPQSLEKYNLDIK